MMRRDAMEALTQFYGDLPNAAPDSLEAAIRPELERSCAEPDLSACTTAVRMVAPLAATIFALGLSLRAESADVEKLAGAVQASQLQSLIEEPPQDTP